MDEESKKQFKWKFYRLTIQLNAIVLLVAISIISLFLIPDRYRLLVTIVSLLIAAVLSFDFVKKYRETKAWLDVHGKKKESIEQSTEQI